MRDFLVLLLHSIVTMIRLTKPGGFRSVIAESVLVRHQLLISNRGRKRAPNLCAGDRIITGLCTLFMAPVPDLAFGMVVKPSFPQPAEETQVPHVVLTAARSSARTERIGETTHRRRCRNETAESELGLSPNCPADRLGFR